MSTSAEWTSDFKLVSVAHAWRQGVATWHRDTDAQVHDLMDGLRTTDIQYTRKVASKENTEQICRVTAVKCNDNAPVVLFVRPDDGYDYRVERVRTEHQSPDEKSNVSELDCVICLTNRRSYIICACGHLVTCRECTVRLLSSSSQQEEAKCPVCRVMVRDGKQSHRLVQRVFF